MNNETQSKLETIVISCITRLYDKEASRGLDIDDLRCLEILFKIAKDSNSHSPDLPLSLPETPENLIDLLRAVKGFSQNDNSSQ